MRGGTPNFAANTSSPTSLMYSDNFMGARNNTFCVDGAITTDTNRSLPGVITTRHTSCVASSSSKASKVTTEGVLSAQRLKEYQRGLTQQQYADLLGLSTSRLGNYLQGTRELGIREAKQIGDALNVPAAYFLGVIDAVDRDILMAPLDKKKMILALIGSDLPRPPGPKAAATEEALTPESRAKKRAVRIGRAARVA